jgi:hypothetical protein
MALCIYCQKMTELCDAGTPVCAECSRAPQHAIYAALREDVAAAEERANSANAAFREVMKDIPSNLPHPDGTQRVLNVCRLLAAARREMMEADSRLNDFLVHGTVPDHLKR